MQNSTIIFLAVLTVVVPVFAEPEIKGSPSELAGYLAGVPKYVTISGKSELKVTADRAIVTIGVLTESKSLETALKSNQDLRTKVVNLLHKGGIAAERIVASRFSSTPKYGLFSDKPSSYKVENLVKIEVVNEKDFQEVAKIIDSFKEVTYKGIEFELSNQDEMERKAIEKACDGVLQKRAIYENKLGIDNM